MVKRWEVRVARFAKRQDPWPEELLPAKAERQWAGEPRRITRLRVGWGPGGRDGNTDTARHSWNRNDANR